MTQFIGIREVGDLVRKTGIGPFLEGLAQYIADDFRRWPDFEKSARIGAHSANGVIELMPTTDGEFYGFKYVNGHPGNTDKGKLTVTGFGVLSDMATGYPLLISEMTVLTALRTAAMSALAASALARPNSRVLAQIGAGAQSEFQAQAFKALLGITEIRVYDIDRGAMDRFASNLAGSGLVIIKAHSVADAVRGADIVTTATADKARATILTPEMIEPGMHINAIGGDCPGKTELHADIVAAAKVFVEFPPQTRVEGEIQQMPADFPVTELWRVLTGEARGRTAASDVTLFDSVGFAIEDFSALRYIRDLTRRTQSHIDLIPELEDPRDLYSLVRPTPPRVRQTAEMELLA